MCLLILLPLCCAMMKSKSSSKNKPWSKAQNKCTSFCVHWVTVLVGLCLGIIVIGLGVSAHQKYSDYYPCTCDGVGFTSFSTACNNNFLLDTVYGIIGYGGGDPLEHHDSTEVGDGPCYQALMICRLHCGPLVSQNPVYEVEHVCNHAPVKNSTSFKSACAQEWNTGVEYLFNPCSWKALNGSTLDSGPPEYDYAGQNKACGDMIDLRPILRTEPNHNIHYAIITLGAFVIWMYFLVILNKCCHCCTRIRANMRERSFRTRFRSTKAGPEESQIFDDGDDDLFSDGEEEDGVVYSRIEHGKTGTAIELAETGFDLAVGKPAPREEEE